MKDWFVQRNWTNFTYDADGQYPEERISFSTPEEASTFTIGSGQNGAWRTMPYRFDSADEAENSVTYRTDICSLPVFLEFVGPPNYFGAWSFDRKKTEEKNGGPNNRYPIRNPLRGLLMGEAGRSADEDGTTDKRDEVATEIGIAIGSRFRYRSR